jgi:hypothetical protein
MVSNKFNCADYCMWCVFGVLVSWFEPAVEPPKFKRLGGKSNDRNTTIQACSRSTRINASYPSNRHTYYFRRIECCQTEISFVHGWSNNTSLLQTNKDGSEESEMPETVMDKDTEASKPDESMKKEEGSATTPSAKQEATYTVKEGDTYGCIAEKTLR